MALYSINYPTYIDSWLLNIKLDWFIISMNVIIAHRIGNVNSWFYPSALKVNAAFAVVHSFPTSPLSWLRLIPKPSYVFGTENCRHLSTLSQSPWYGERLLVFLMGYWTLFGSWLLAIEIWVGYGRVGLVVGGIRLERTTFAMSTQCSNQLS